MAVRPTTANTYDVALCLGCGALPVYYRENGAEVDVIDPNTGEEWSLPVAVFRARHVTLAQQMPDNLRAKARSVPSFREWQAQQRAKNQERP